MNLSSTPYRYHSMLPAQPLSCWHRPLLFCGKYEVSAPTRDTLLTPYLSLRALPTRRRTRFTKGKEGWLSTSEPSTCRQRKKEKGSWYSTSRRGGGRLPRDLASPCRYQKGHHAPRLASMPGERKYVPGSAPSSEGARRRTCRPLQRGSSA